MHLIIKAKSGEEMAWQAARSGRACLDFLVLLHQGKRTERKGY
jgi:hypothetical protein